MTKDQFLDQLARLDRKSVNTVLWTLYWRGPAAVRQRIETELVAAAHGIPSRPAAPPPADGAAVRAEVEQFVDLARSGAYLGRDRRVSPKEGTRWRITFKRLAAEAQRGLVGADPDDAIAAVELLIDLACEMNGTDYFRSEDPV